MIINNVQQDLYFKTLKTGFSISQSYDSTDLSKDNVKT